MRTKHPYTSTVLDASLRDELHKRGVVFSRADAALKNVALVGALLPYTEPVKNGQMHASDMWHYDRDQAVQTIDFMAKSGIPVHPDLHFDVYNLLPPVSSDFLMAALPGMYGGRFKDFVQFPDADLVCVCSVPIMGSTPMHRDYNVSRGFEELSTQTLYAGRNCGIYTSVSRMHDDYNIWPEAAFALKAKFVQVRGSTGDEISTKQFKDHDEVAVLIATDHIKYGNFGIVAHAPSLPLYAESANAETRLGAAILDYLK